MASFSIRRPCVRFEGPYASDPTGRGFPNYNVSLDGEWFLIVTRGGDSNVPALPVVQNWFAELKERAPVDRARNQSRVASEKHIFEHISSILVKKPSDGDPDGAAEVTRQRLDVVDVSDDPQAAEPKSVVVAFQCTSCRKLLHVEFSVSPFESAGGSSDGIVCPGCDHPLRLRLPGPVRKVLPAD